MKTCLRYCSRQVKTSLRLIYSAIWGGVVVFAVLGSGPVLAQTADERIRLLEQTVRDLLERDAQKEKTIEKLRGEVGALKRGNRGPVGTEETGHAGVAKAPAPGGSTTKHVNQRGHGHDHAHDHGKGDATDDGIPDLYAVDVAGGTLRLRGTGVNTAFAAGYSSEKKATIGLLQGGDHDPQQNGFDLQSVDFGFLGAFDPYFDAEVHVALNIDTEGETKLELEEAFMVTQDGVLPGGLELELGQFFTEFGAYNPVHLHDQAFIDQPVIVGRLFGADGLRGQGARVGWKVPVPWRSKLHVGAQNATGETQASFLANDEVFEERAVGGRAFRDREVDSINELTYLARLANRFQAGEDTAVTVGASGLIGPNATGSDANTYIAGIDVKAHHNLHDGRFVEFQGEFMYRHYEAAGQSDEGFAAADLEDYGIYAFARYGFQPRWSVGLRGEYATGDGASVGEFAGRSQDPFRSDRIRISPLLAWQFAPTGNVRLQYNYDNADFLTDDDAHSVWLGFQWAFGAGEAVHVSGGGGHDHHDH